MPKIDALDRLKSQLLTSGLSQKNQPLFQVINQLITLLRQTIDEIQTQIDDITPVSPVPPSIISNVPMPFVLESNDDYSPICTTIPGPPGPRGPAGIANNASVMPFWYPEEDEPQETLPLLTLANSNQIIPGEWTFTNNLLRLASTSPRIVFRDAAGGADSKHWVMTVVSGVLYLQAYDDTLSTSSNALLLVRTGTNIDSIRIQTGAGVLRTIWDTNGVMDHRFGLQFSGVSSVSVAADQTAWNPTGLGTSAFLIRVSPTGAGFFIRGILAQAGGTIIAIHNPSANPIAIQHEDGAASAANRILMPTGVSVSLNQYNTYVFQYDSTASRWIMICRTF